MSQTGISDGTLVEIRKGLADGDEVATENPEEEKAAEARALADK